MMQLVWLLVFSFLVLTEAKSVRWSEIKVPSCSFSNDAMKISWKYDDASTDVVFKIKATSPLNDFWAGVFFGEDEPEDSVGVFVRSGQIGVMDGHVVNALLRMDDVTNVQSLSFDLQGDELTAEIGRPTFTKDKKDKELSNCVNFFFPAEAVKVRAGGKILVPERMESRRVCDIQVNCGSKSQASEVAKRPDFSVCEHTKGKNTVTWRALGDAVEFSIWQEARKGKWWSAIGIGHSMEDLKMAIAFLENGKTLYVGGYQSEGHAVIRRDFNVKPVVNLENGYEGLSPLNLASELIEEATDVSNGRSHVDFILPLGLFDLYSDDTGCVTIQISVNAGRWRRRFELLKHERIPEAVLVCGIDHCRDPEAVSSNDDGEEHNDADKAEDEENTPLASMELAESADANPDEERLLKKEVPREIDNAAVLHSPLQETVQSDGTESSGVEPAIKESSIFASAVEAVDQMPGGSEAGDVTVPAVSGGDSDAGEQGSGVEVPNEDVPHDSEVTANSVLTEESGANPTTAADQPEHTSNPSTKVFLTEATTTPVTAAAIDNAPQTAEKESVVPPANHFFTTSESTLIAIEPSSTTTATAATTALTGESSTTTSVQPLVIPKTVDRSIVKILEEGCTEGHSDLRVCESYFADYLTKVKEWAEKHNHVPGEQMWKACMLLSRVQHVPTMCCTKFRSTCAAHLRAAPL